MLSYLINYMPELELKGNNKNASFLQIVHSIE